MKKILNILLLSTLFLLSSFRVSFAEESKIIKEQNGGVCIDLAAYYEAANMTSQALTGKEQSPLATKKARNIATLTNIIGILMGDSIYCVNDGEAASKTKMLKNHGILGALNGSTYALLTSTPTVRVGDHLAQEFIPGYGDNNRASAADKYVWNDNNYTSYNDENVRCGDLPVNVREVMEDLSSCKNKKVVTIDMSIGDINQGDWKERCGDKGDLSESLKCFWEYVGYGGYGTSVENPLSTICTYPCFTNNHSDYMSVFYELYYEEEEEPPSEDVSECPEGCEYCEDISGQNFTDIPDIVYAYNGEIRVQLGPGGQMLQLTISEQEKVDQCTQKLMDGDSYNNYLNLLKELGVEWQEGDSYCFSNNWSSLTGTSEADCTPHYSHTDVDYCIQRYCETEAYRKAKENEVGCGRPNISSFLVQPDKYYASELECQADQEQRDEEVEIMQESIDYNTTNMLNKWKQWLINQILKYLGFGEIDYDRLNEQARMAVEQKSGFEYLHDSIQLSALWSITRNIAYLFFVIAMIVIGFMIMFRNKIGGQVMVTVSNSIPRIIICLILVTFSFAISGIMLDLGKMAMNVIGNTMVEAQMKVAKGPVEEIDIASIGNLTDQLLYKSDPGNTSIISGRELDDQVGKAIDNRLGEKNRRKSLSAEWVGETSTVVMKIFLRLGGAFLLGSARQADLSPDVLTFLAPLSAVALSWINLSWKLIIFAFQVPNYSRLFKLVVFLIIGVVASFKLFVTIITTYVKIFANVVLGPIQIAMGAIPGNFGSVGRWFKSLIANILVFPTIVAILGFAQFFVVAIEPQKFVFFGQQGVFLPDGIITMQGVFLIAGYFFAATAPNLIKGVIKIEEDKTMAAAGDSIKKSMSKIPMIGGMFGK
ncbi:MAG: hypothetical protein ACOX06_01410 [Candidatus Dojkabacteria bacterium]